MLFIFYFRRQQQQQLTNSSQNPPSLPVQASTTVALNASGAPVEIKSEPKEETKSLYVSGLLDGREEKVIRIL